MAEIEVCSTAILSREFAVQTLQSGPCPQVMDGQLSQWRGNMLSQMQVYNQRKVPELRAPNTETDPSRAAK